MPIQTCAIHSDALSRRDFVKIASTSAEGLILAGCAKNPVTGKSQLMLLGEGDETAIDREQSPHQFSEDFGAIYEPRVNQYVERVGRHPLQTLSRDRSQRSSRRHRPEAAGSDSVT